MEQELWRLDATAQAELVRGGLVSARELADAALARVGRLNPALNAVVSMPAERVIADMPASGAPPFCGVPMLLKDASAQLEGTSYWLGLGPMRDAGYRSRHTTELVRRLEAAGFVFIGKTNVPELSAGITTEPPAFGAARNPWDPGRTTSGSSGGSAAAVAAGMTSIAHGADGTGSLRYPAAACGVVTLKPSRGLVPSSTPTGAPDVLGVWSEFVLARSVRDLAGVLDAVCDRQDRARPYVATLLEPRSRLRVGMLLRDIVAGLPLDEACVEAVRRAGTLLASMGHAVEEAHPPALEGAGMRIGRAVAVLGPQIRAEQIAWVERCIGRPLEHGEIADEQFVARDAAAAITGTMRSEASTRLRAEEEPLRAWWRDGWDILLTPVLRQPAWPLGSAGGALDAGAFPAPFSVSGQPAMSLPLHVSPGGLPVGVQVVADVGQDALLLRIAAALERAAPWAARWPPVATR